MCLYSQRRKSCRRCPLSCQPPQAKRADITGPRAHASNEPPPTHPRHIRAVGYKLLRRATYEPPRRSSRGRLVVITGAAQGIGRLMSFEFARRGSKLALWDLDAETLEATAVEIRDAVPGAEVRTYICNLADRLAVY